MITSPYNLEIKTGNSTQFYDDLSNFTQKVIIKGRKELQLFLTDYSNYCKSKQLKEYTTEEYLMEILMTGIYWKNYHKFLSINAILYRPLFNQLYALRKNNGCDKSRIDSYRGRLAYKLLASENNKNLSNYERFDYLLSWLDCTKEYTMEVERLDNWKLFMENQDEAFEASFWADIIDFADWFEKESETHLGKYTKGWGNFMMDNSAEYKNKEDYFFCTRKPNEYHLNMVAAEVMNGALKKQYNDAKNKIVLLPTCMSKNENCQAKMDGQNLNCMHCNENCNVSKLTNQLNKMGVNTVLIPHSSSFSNFLKPWENSTDTALIGVACTLNLITGGYEMQKLNIPSQCVFLDSCGCKKHWLSGKATNLNTDQLNKILIHERVSEPINSTC